MEKIKLREDQQKHIERLREILRKSYYAFDLSDRGTGKTYTATALANSIGAKMIVICPNALRMKWENEIKEHYENNIIEVINYEKLGGRESSQPSHGYLVRIDTYIEPTDEKGTGEINTTFEPSTQLNNLLKNETVLIVFDEEHKNKNESIRYKASKAIMKSVLKSGRSRALLMSATLADKIEHIERLMKMIGIIAKYNIMGKTLETGEFILYGIQEVIDRAMMYNKNAVVKYLNNVGSITRDNYQIIIYRLFVDIILPRLSSKMTYVVSGVNQYVFNHYYDCPRDEKDKIIKYIDDLNNKILFFNAEKREMEVSKGVSRTYIMNMMRNIERSKVNIFIREAKKILDATPYIKVAIFLTLVEDAIEIVCDKLKSYKPLKLTGEKTQKERNEIVEKFNRPTLEYRLLVANIVIASEGIDLDDQNGCCPRVVLAIPSYDIISTHQMIGRFKRAKTRTDSIINFVYVLSDTKEVRLMKALSKKGDILKEVSLDTSDTAVMYPDEYKEISDPSIY